jgi:hypothetical protein
MATSISVPIRGVDGGILVEKSNSWFSWSNSKPPRVVIGPRAVIGGSMVFQREVELHVSESEYIKAQFARIGLQARQRQRLVPDRADGGNHRRRSVDRRCGDRSAA